MTPDNPREHVYLVQVLASVEVVAADKNEAAEVALDAISRRCETRRELFVHVEEVKR
jgi:hypothetical protein